MVLISEVSKRYRKDKPLAVSDLTLEIASGEIFGFLGPNGAGKSTTINMMVGKIVQDQGTILIDGHDTLKDALDAKKVVGYVPDEPRLYEKMTGRRYLDFICDVFFIGDERDEQIVHWASRFNLEEALDDQISSYSRGMKQKLGIISALVHRPKILILDEPMVGLDPKSAFVLKEVMRELCNEGGTVFFSTHVMEVAERVCDRVGIIHNGTLVAHGPFAQLREAQGEMGATLEQLFLELTDEHQESVIADESR